MKYLMPLVSKYQSEGEISNRNNVDAFNLKFHCFSNKKNKICNQDIKKLFGIKKIVRNASSDNMMAINRKVIHSGSSYESLPSIALNIKQKRILIPTNTSAISSTTIVCN